MSDSVQLSQTPPSRVFRQVATKYAFYIETIVGFAFPAILTNLINDSASSFDNLLDWLVVSTAGYGAAVAVLVLGRFLFLKRLRISLLSVLATFAIAGLARGATIFGLGSIMNLVKPEEFAYRVYGSMVYSTFLLGLFTVLVSNAVRTSTKSDELEQQMVNLQDALINLREKLAVQKAELAGRVKALVYPMVEELIAKVSDSRSSGSVAEAVASLKEAVDSEIRPLSLAISDSQDSGLLAMTGTPKARFRLFTRLPEPIAVGALFAPLWMTLFMLIITTSVAIHVFGPVDGPLQILLALVVSFAALSLAKFSLRNVVLRQDRAFSVQLAVYIVTGASIDLALWFSPFNEGVHQFGKVTIFVTVIGIGFFVGQILQLQRDSATRSLETINDRLEKLTAGARRELWLYRRKVATVLHGPVQARLYASAIRLSQAKKVNKALVDRVSDELRAALSELDFERSKSPSLREVLRQIIDVWAGSCEVYAKIDKSVYVLAKKDSDFNEAFIEVVREAVSNGVKHSKASEIEIAADLVGDLVQLRISNNGTIAEVSPEATKAGFGTTLFDELTLSWKLAKGDDGRILFAAELVAN